MEALNRTLHERKNARERPHLRLHPIIPVRTVLFISHTVTAFGELPQEVWLLLLSLSANAMAPTPPSSGAASTAHDYDYSTGSESEAAQSDEKDHNVDKSQNDRTNEAVIDNQGENNVVEIIDLVDSPDVARRLEQQVENVARRPEPEGDDSSLEDDLLLGELRGKTVFRVTDSDHSVTEDQKKSPEHVKIPSIDGEKSDHSTVKDHKHSKVVNAPSNNGEQSGSDWSPTEDRTKSPEEFKVPSIGFKKCDSSAHSTMKDRKYSEVANAPFNKGKTSGLECSIITDDRTKSPEESKMPSGEDDIKMPPTGGSPDMLLGSTANDDDPNEKKGERGRKKKKKRHRGRDENGTRTRRSSRKKKRKRAEKESWSPLSDSNQEKEAGNKRRKMDVSSSSAPLQLPTRSHSPSSSSAKSPTASTTSSVSGLDSAKQREPGTDIGSRVYAEFTNKFWYWAIITDVKWNQLSHFDQYSVRGYFGHF